MQEVSDVPPEDPGDIASDSSEGSFRIGAIRDDRELVDHPTPCRCLSGCLTAPNRWLLWRVLRTIPYWANNFVNGVSVGVLGPTLLLLRENVGDDKVSYIFAFKSLGKGLGCLASGFLYDLLGEKLHRACLGTEAGRKRCCIRWSLSLQIYQAICTIAVALTMVVQPWIWNVYLLIAINFLGGFFAGLFEPGSTVGIKWIWGLRKMDVPILFLYFNTGLGLFVFPALVGVARGLVDHIGRWHELLASYVLCAVLCLTPIPFYLCCSSPILPLDEDRRDVSEGLLGPSVNPCCSSQVVSCLCREFSPELPRVPIGGFANIFFWLLSSLFCLFYCACEMCSGGLVLIYALGKNLESTEAAAIVVMTIFFGTMTFGRLPGMWISRVLPKYLVLLGSIVVAMIGFVLMRIWNDNTWVFRVSMALVGCGFSTIYPTHMSFPSSNFNFNTGGFVLSMALVGTFVGLAIPSAVQVAMEKSDLNYFLHAQMGMLGMCAIILTLEQIYGYVSVRVFLKKENGPVRTRRSSNTRKRVEVELPDRPLKEVRV